MQYSLALLALVASVSAQSAGPYPSNGTQYTTITTTAFTTYCPEATILTHGGNTYTVTEATTLTITDCPCTITQPIIQPTPSTVLYTSCPPESSNTPPPPAPPAPEPTTTYTNPLTVITQTSKGVAVTSTVGCPGAGCAPPASTPATCNGNCPKSGTASGTGSVPSPTSPSQFTGAASANKVGGVMLAAVGVVALAL